MLFCKFQEYFFDFLSFCIALPISSVVVLGMESKEVKRLSRIVVPIVSASILPPNLIGELYHVLYYPQSKGKEIRSLHSSVCL